MAVDWETIIKIYRDRLSDKTFSTLHEQADHFLSFLQDSRDLFDEQSQLEFVERMLITEFSSIRENMFRKTQQKIEDAGEITQTVLRAHLRSVVTERRDALRQMEDVKSIDGADLPNKHLDEIRSEHSAAIQLARRKVMEDLPIDSGISRKLNEIGFFVLTKAGAYRGSSGVVIAGYGEDEFFPSVKEFELEGILQDTIKFSRRQSEAIDRKNGAMIMPFAQSDMVHTFMEGVDYSYQRYIDAAIRKRLDTYGKTMLDMLAPDNSVVRDRYLRSMSKANDTIANDLEEDLAAIRRRVFWHPVVRIVSKLPKSELAAMAESLINLTSFRRHVTPYEETVGGPIDVAVISRGDGFVWIKRKHYFEGDLNQHFFANYFREVAT